MPKQRNSSGWSYNNAAGPSKPGGRGPNNRVTGAGKKATAQKNQLYSKPLPVELDGASEHDIAEMKPHHRYGRVFCRC